jgi:acetyl-CoA carboxylase carboxyl transferase subunit alpha
MPTETLEFEESLAPLLKEVDALSALPRTDARERELDRLNHRLRTARAEIYSKLTPWQRVLVSRHPSRPDMLDYVSRLFTATAALRTITPSLRARPATKGSR